MRRGRENFATEIIGKVKKERNFWMAVAAVSIVLNMIQWIF
jgi:hypothetical protein